jgi:hypothetical protein
MEEMTEKKVDKYFEITNRACDALVLGYNSRDILGKDFEKNFYIPCCSEIESSFGFALRKILGVKKGYIHLADCVRWDTIADLDKLEKRIYEGANEVIIGDPEYETIFSSYLHGLNSRNFESTWIYLRGDLYRFRKEKREEALEKFENFWTEKEKKRWKEVHNFMRSYTVKNYKEKEEKWLV